MIAEKGLAAALFHSFLAGLFALALITSPRQAGAQVDAPPAQSENPASRPEPAGDKKDEAIARFKKGLELQDKGAWAAALAEFLVARRMYPLRNAAFQAGICLEKLDRYDEALEVFEGTLRDFSESMPPAAREIVQRKVLDVRGLVGTLEVEGAEPGSAIAIDGRERGEFPLLTPLRVNAGSHVVRAFKEGFLPFETRVEVAGGQSARVSARMRALTSSGRLHVTEQSGKALTVFIDGSAVGKTPWEGRLAVGNHVVTLRGEGQLGTQPASVSVELNKNTALALAAEELTAELHIEPVPMNASVAIDAIGVGSGLWQGRLRAGEHRIEAAAAGFVPEARQVTLRPGEREVVRIALRRDEASPFWRKPPRPPRFIAELSAAAALVPTFGGDIAGACIKDCKRSAGAGGMSVLYAGYELGSGLSFGAAIGYFAATQSTEERFTSIKPVDLGSPPALPAEAGRGAADDRLALRGVLAGAFIAFAIGERFPLRLRMGAGILAGDLLDERTGRFQASTGGAFSPGWAIERHDARFIYAAPEVRWGIRLHRRAELSIGVAAPVLIRIEEPRWDVAQTHYVRAGDDGLGTFAAEALIGPVVVAITPGVGARYDF